MNEINEYCYKRLEYRDLNTLAQILGISDKIQFVYKIKLKLIKQGYNIAWFGKGRWDEKYYFITRNKNNQETLDI